MKHLRRSLAPLLLVALAARAAPAETPAEAALQHGVELRKEGKDEEALREFERANQLSPSPRARAQIGLAEQALGRWVEAEVHLEGALREREDPWIARQAEPLERALATVVRHLGSLEIVANIAGAELSLNGAPRMALPMPRAARVVAGTVVIEVRAPGYLDVRRSVEVAPGAAMREQVTLVAARDNLVPPPRVEPEPARVVSPPSKAVRTAGFVVGAAGVVGVVVGSYFGIRTLANKSDRDAHCSAAGCDPTGLQLDHDARRNALISTVGFAGGIGLLGIGALLVWRGGGDAAPQAATVRIAPRVGASGAGLFAEGRF